MNSELENNFYKDFNTACELFEKGHSRDQIIDMIRNGNLVEKHFGVLNLDTIQSLEEGKILASNLTKQDGKIREAVSFKIKEFLSDPNTRQYLETEGNYKIFLDAIIDINGNICRNTILGISNLKNNFEFCKFFLPKLEEMALELIPKIKEFGEIEGYKVNKEAFKLYWCLETIYTFAENMKIESLENILTKAKAIKEYTIREKCAKILTKDVFSETLENIRQELKQDSNYYVRRY